MTRASGTQGGRASDTQGGRVALSKDGLPGWLDPVVHAV